MMCSKGRSWSKMNNPAAWLAVMCVLIIGRSIVSAFSVGTSSFTARPSRTCLDMSTPGGWENDDFLESLGGGGGDSGDPNEGYGESAERNVPGNDMTDEEITMMAMRSA